MMTSTLKTPDFLPDGVWQGLLQQAYSLIDEIGTHGIENPFWTFGGGTNDPYTLTVDGLNLNARQPHGGPSFDLPHFTELRRVLQNTHL